MTKLEELRTAKGLTQEKIATSAGIAVSTYSLYENGHRCVPLKTAERIAEMVGCAVDDIFLPEKFTVSKIECHDYKEPLPVEGLGTENPLEGRDGA